MKVKVEYYLQNNPEKYEIIVIIPGTGCTGCITEAESFFINNYANEKIKFIFTNILSYKILRLKVGENRLNRKNVLIDKANHFYLDNFEERIYPVRIKIENMNVIKIERLGY